MAAAFRKFRKLKIGDRLWVVAPSGPLRSRKDFYGGVEILMRAFGVEVRRSVFAAKGFFAGSDLLRRREMNRAIGQAGCSAIYAMRGGYGVTRILEGIDWRAWESAPKPVIGLSDLTALHFALLSRGLGFGIHAPSVPALRRQPGKYVKHLFRLLLDASCDFAPPPVKLAPLRRGRARGPLVGGNLTMIDQLTGTGFMPGLDGCILLLEDVNEPAYKIDRMLVHLKQAGILGRAAGIVLGRFTRCGSGKGKVSLKEVFMDNFGPLRVPVAAGFPAGHGQRNWAFVQGAGITMTCGAGSVEMAQPQKGMGD
ncbi:MAG: LD-carboxypeptidase [Pseudomonadota bacterium]